METLSLPWSTCHGTYASVFSVDLLYMFIRRKYEDCRLWLLRNSAERNANNVSMFNFSYILYKLWSDTHRCFKQIFPRCIYGTKLKTFCLWLLLNRAQHVNFFYVQSNVVELNLMPQHGQTWKICHGPICITVVSKSSPDISMEQDSSPWNTGHDQVYIAVFSRLLAVSMEPV